MTKQHTKSKDWDKLDEIDAGKLIDVTPIPGGVHIGVKRLLSFISSLIKRVREETLDAVDRYTEESELPHINRSKIIDTLNKEE